MSHVDEAGCFPATAPRDWNGEIYHRPPALPLGEWRVMANGRIHHLNLTAVSGGVVTGTYNDLPIEAGYWDGNMLTFYRVETRIPSEILRQKFVGYLMQYVNPDYKWRIAGVFQADPDRHDIGPGGWYATLQRDSAPSASG